MVASPSLFRKLHHVCIVVNDIDRTRQYYESLGIGPWRAYPPLAEYTELDVPDESAFMAMKYEVADLDNFQLQLCQPPDRDCPQRRFLVDHGEGVFHLGFEVDDYDRTKAEAESIGLPTLMAGRRNDGSGFQYYDTQERAGVTLLVRESPGIPS